MCFISNMAVFTHQCSSVLFDMLVHNLYVNALISLPVKNGTAQSGLVLLSALTHVGFCLSNRCLMIMLRDRGVCHHPGTQELSKMQSKAHHAEGQRTCRKFKASLIYQCYNKTKVAKFYTSSFIACKSHHVPRMCTANNVHFRA